MSAKVHDQDQSRKLLRRLPRRPGDPARDAAHRHRRRCRALHRALRRALCRAIIRRLRRSDRLSPGADRRSARVPHRVRQDRARHLAQCGRQSRLRRVPVPAPGLSRRYAQRRVGGDRPAREFEPQDRRGLCALARLQPGRQRGARLCALGDGAQARRRPPPRRPSRCPRCRRRCTPAHAGRRLSADQCRGL